MKFKFLAQAVKTGFWHRPGSRASWQKQVAAVKLEGTGLPGGNEATRSGIKAKGQRYKGN
jgi:hypothetical protein